jgi:hypothetical protein
MTRLMITNSLQSETAKQALPITFTVEGFYFFSSFKYLPHSLSPFEVEIRALF